MRAAWIFYTRFPLPGNDLDPSDFRGIARWLPWVGLSLGLVLWGGDLLFSQGPDLVRGVMVTALWVVCTGGLHLDGVADAADGLAVAAHDPAGQERRLRVMRDSRSGPYGVMALVLVLLLKSATLASLNSSCAWILLLIPAWGRWGQLLAIGCYPYLRAEGQGKFLKTDLIWPQDLLLGTLALLLLTLGLGIGNGILGWLSLWTGLVIGSAWAVGSWFHRQLGGHTGDTYGAVVEWTEVVTLLWLTLIPAPELL
jgi:adenosylcobinamide-GDP ribazoletransferase